jgi:hypothetical protein
MLLPRQFSAVLMFTGEPICAAGAEDVLEMLRHTFLLHQRYSRVTRF